MPLFFTTAEDRENTTNTLWFDDRAAVEKSWIDYRAVGTTFFKVLSTLPLIIDVWFKSQNQKLIEFKGKKFVLTGEFITARRKDVATAIEQRGGILQQCTSSKTDYIIVGSVASGAWSNESYGRKIETALKHPNIVFIAEKDFTRRLK